MTRHCPAVRAVALVLAVALAPACTRASTPPGVAPERRSVGTAGERQRPLRQPEPFEVRLAKVRVEPLGNRRLFGQRAAARFPTRGRKAARAATANYRRYLDTTFVARGSRGTRKGLRQFVTKPLRRSLRSRDLRALGAKGLRIDGGRRARATVRATVMQDGREPVAVLLRVRARMHAVTPAGDGRLLQDGAVVMARGAKRWRATMLDLRLRAPGQARTSKDQRKGEREGKDKGQRKREQGSGQRAGGRHSGKGRS